MTNTICDPFELIEARREVVQAELDSRKSAAERNRLGQFATPNKLALDIAKYVATFVGAPTTPIRFADPSIGTGSFFSAALAVFGPARMTSAVGVELDPGFADAASELWDGTNLQVVRGDFTRVVGETRSICPPDVILANGTCQ
jgi:hypothetical protein